MKSASIAATAVVSLCAIIGSAYLSLPVIVGVLCAASLVVGFGWPYVLGVPAKKTLGSIIAGSGIASAATAGLLDGGRVLLWFPAIVALGVMLVFLVQLLRGTGQSLRLESTIGASAGVLVSSMGGGWVGAERLASNTADTGMMLVTGASVVVALLVSLLPWPDRIIAPIGLLLATLAGPLGSVFFAQVAPLGAAVVGLFCGAVVVSFRRLVVAGRGPHTRPGLLAIGVAPIMILGALVYFLEKLLPL